MVPPLALLWDGPRWGAASVHPPPRPPPPPPTQLWAFGWAPVGAASWLGHRGRAGPLRGWGRPAPPAHPPPHGCPRTGCPLAGPRVQGVALSGAWGSRGLLLAWTTALPWTLAPAWAPRPLGLLGVLAHRTFPTPWCRRLGLAWGVWVGGCRQWFEHQLAQVMAVHARVLCLRALATTATAAAAATATTVPAAPASAVVVAMVVLGMTIGVGVVGVVGVVRASLCGTGCPRACRPLRPSGPPPHHPPWHAAPYRWPEG